MSRRRLIVLGGLIGVTLMAAAAYLFSGDPAPERRRPNAGVSPSVASVLPELFAFVEAARGLEFREEVRVTVLSEELFREQLGRTAPDPHDIARLDAVLTVLGLLPPDADLAALLAGSAAKTAGFYDLEKKELVAGTELTPLRRRILVHELTHALDDQHFGIDRTIEGDQAAAAFNALVEGSAIRVERLYMDSLPPAEQEAVAREELRFESTPQLPEGLEQLFGFPHLLGPPFVDALLAAGPGQLDRAFAAPPVSAEQVIDPARYLAGDVPQMIRPPHTEGATIDQGEIGPVLLRLLLESQVEPSVAARAVAGWDGDRYATWRSPDGRTCIRAAFATDSPQDAQELGAALAAWVSRTADREVDSAGLLLKACSRRD